MEAPSDLVLSLYPPGSKVYLHRHVIADLCGLYKPKLDTIVSSQWTVLNYYYEIGTRASTFSSMIVGIDYSIWSTMTPNVKFVASTYGQLPTKSGRSRLKFRPPHDTFIVGCNKLCIVSLTNWNGTSYDEIVDKPIDLYAGFLGDAF